MKKHKLLYTTREAAEALPQYETSGSVKARIHEGKIKAEKIGRDWFIPAVEIERLKKNAKQGTKIKDNFPRF